ncbi:PIG-L family deacetylase [Rhodocaloribacter litoris]|uniref:PIG-L deacetylase family protein n=1 Tax=Rhodocaloribacter litoris TaxID=2558931 RepID=UPI001E4C3F6A|nr:PIG-L deacetylase family protein [Rhodocaloribacter litoris]QXD14294.1 PIG-L family deacetylase [Rhodocaloribacter litoris]
MTNDANEVSRVLVIAAHPDDEVLGCGGTLARLADEGHTVHVAILGEGITSRHSRREDADPAAVAALRAHSRAAARALGVPEPQFFDLPDNRFDTVPLLDLVKCIEGLIDAVRPEVVFTQHGGDLNIDHARVYRATLTATRPMVGTPVQRVLAYEIPSSTEYAFGQFAPAFRPTVFVDITATLERKLAAMACYESEARPYPHPRSPEALRAIARRWGSVCGRAAAEAFMLVRAIY